MDITIQDGFNEAAATREGVMLFNRHDIYIGASLRLYGEYSHGEVQLFRQLVKPGMTVVEVGANIGAHTLPLSHMAEPGAVLAFEPQRLVFQLLCANAALNSRANILPYAWAIGRTCGRIGVPLLSPTMAENFGGLALEGAQGDEQVELRTIDSLALDRLDFLKIDVEGMEQDVLLGAADSIRRHRPIIYLENDREDRSADLIRTLFAFDYRLFWHFPPLFRPDNFRGVTENIFDALVSANMLCIPQEVSINIVDMPEVTDPAETWRTYSQPR